MRYEGIPQPINKFGETFYDWYNLMEYAAKHKIPLCTKSGQKVWLLNHFELPVKDDTFRGYIVTTGDDGYYRYHYSEWNENGECLDDDYYEPSDLFEIVGFWEDEWKERTYVSQKLLKEEKPTKMWVVTLEGVVPYKKSVSKELFDKKLVYASKELAECKLKEVLSKL